MKVRDIMTSEGLATAGLDTTLEEIAGMMRDENVGAIPVLDEDEELAGIITDRDIVVRAIAEGQDPAETTAEDILSEALHTIHQDADIEDAADLMARHKIRRLPVVEEGIIIGMISLGDISVKGEEDQAGDVLEDVSEGVKQSDGGSRKESRSVPRGDGRTEVGTGTDGGSRGGQTRGQENGGRNRGGEASGGRAKAHVAEAHVQTRQNQPTGNRTEVRGERQGNREQPSARGRHNTSARGGESGQARGENARSQGVTNRSSGEERSRQQKVTPMREEASHPGRNRNRKRAS